MSEVCNKVSVSKIKERFATEGFESDSIIVLSYHNFDQMDQLKQDMDGAMVGVVCAGSLRLTINDVSYKLGEGELFVIHEDTNLEQIKVSKNCVGYIMIFKRKYMMSMDVETKEYMFADMNARITPVFKVEEDVANSINEVVISLLDVARGGDIHFKEGVIASLTRAVIYMVLSVLFPSSVAKVKGGKTANYMTRFVELLGEEHQRERSVEFYANKMGITPKYLTMMCRKYRGLTASQMIDNAVIHNAMRMLKQQGVSVQQVSEQLNFPSQSFFGKYFKQRVGISPSRYKWQSH